MGKTASEIIDDLRAEYGHQLDEMIDKSFWDESGLGVCTECDWQQNVYFEEDQGECESCFSNSVQSVFVLWEGRKK